MNTLGKPPERHPAGQPYGTPRSNHHYNTAHPEILGIHRKAELVVRGVSPASGKNRNHPPHKRRAKKQTVKAIQHPSMPG